jgi:hypothetical protein
VEKGRLSVGLLSKYSVRIVFLLVLVEAVADIFLWSLSPVTQAGEGVFAVLLAINLVSLAMISNIYRAFKHGYPLNKAFLITGCALIVLFVCVSLVL